MNNIINMIKEIKMLSYQELKNQNMNAMRNKDKKLQSVLSTLIGKIDNEGKLRMANQNRKKKLFWKPSNPV